MDGVLAVSSNTSKFLPLVVGNKLPFVFFGSSSFIMHDKVKHMENNF